MQGLEFHSDQIVRAINCQTVVNSRKQLKTLFEMDGGDKHRTTKDWKSEMIILERRDEQTTRTMERDTKFKSVRE